MDAKSKGLKIFCLISLFFGLAEIVSGFVLQAPMGVSIMTAFTPMAAGVLSLVLGVHGARAANVPSNAQKLRTFALVITLLSCAVTGLAAYLGHGPSSFMYVCAIGTLLDAMIVFSAHAVKRALDRA